MNSREGIDLVVACTKRKRPKVDASLHFSSLPSGTVDEVASWWLERISQAPSKPLDEVYCGPGWAAALRARDAGRVASEVRLHVVSAGLGLLGPGTQIPAYSATFATDPDQIALRVVDARLNEPHQLWWKALNRERGNEEQPLSAALSNSRQVLVAVGVDYLTALEDDLELLATQLGQERLFIICAGAQRKRLPKAVSACLLPVGIEVEAIYRGTRNALNAWAAGWVLQRTAEEGWSRTAIEAQLGTLLAQGASERRKVIGRAQTDDDVRAWIGRELARDPKAVGLLPKFRRQGLACVDRRFRRIAAEVRQQMERGAAAV